MEWGKLWDGAAVQTHGIHDRGDHLNTWCMGLMGLAVMGVLAFLMLKLVFDRKPRKRK